MNFGRSAGVMTGMRRSVSLAAAGFLGALAFCISGTRAFGDSARGAVLAAPAQAGVGLPADIPADAADPGLSGTPCVRVRRAFRAVEPRASMEHLGERWSPTAGFALPAVHRKLPPPSEDSPTPH